MFTQQNGLLFPVEIHITIQIGVVMPSNRSYFRFLHPARRIVGANLSPTLTAHDFF